MQKVDEKVASTAGKSGVSKAVMTVAWKVVYLADQMVVNLAQKMTDLKVSD